MGRLGAHVSIAGGIARSVPRAMEIGCESFQIFSRNQRRWAPPPLDEEGAIHFTNELESSGMGPVLVHGSYLLNPASGKRDILEKTTDALIDEIYRCNALGLDRLVIHPGSHMGEGIEEGIKNVVNLLERVLSLDEGSTRILLETTAGQGRGLGSTLEEIASIIDRTAYGERLGICLDTCHMYAAGYDLSDREKYERTMDSIEDLIGIDKVLGIHLNDSVTELASRRDRHAGIGKGRMGLDTFVYLVNDPRFQDTPMILETPGGPDSYKKELQLLRSLKVV